MVPIRHVGVRLALALTNGQGWLPGHVTCAVSFIGPHAKKGHLYLCCYHLEILNNFLQRVHILILHWALQMTQLVLILGCTEQVCALQASL